MTESDWNNSYNYNSPMKYESQVLSNQASLKFSLHLSVLSSGGSKMVASSIK